MEKTAIQWIKGAAAKLRDHKLQRLGGKEIGLLLDGVVQSLGLESREETIMFTALFDRYDFSGGEIDNITRKAVMTEVLESSAPSIDALLKLCDEEKIGSSKATRVGFK